MSYSANVIIGIDLGTTNSCVAFMDGSKPKVIVNKEGNMTTPSIYAETKNGTRLIGEAAKRQLVVNPHGTVYGAKRLIGRKIDDKEIQGFINSVGYACEKGKNGEIEITVEGKEKNKYTPAQIGSFVLQEIKRYAEDFLGTKVKDAVITVPAYFNDAQRQATKDAGTIAGLNVLRVINEPTAAALAYGFDQVDSKSDKTIAVYDFGGGTFDVSILEIGNGITEVKATNGDTNLGGTDFDMAIKQYLIDEFKKETSVDLSKDDLALQRLIEASEKAKIALSNSTSTEINLPYISSINGVPQHMQITITRTKLEALTKHLIDKTLGPCKTALSDAGKKINEIDEVILVGGMTRMPKIVEFVKEFFGKTPNMSVNPDEVVAMGAAIQGGVLSGSIKDVLLLDVTPLSLGIETLGGVFSKLIEKNTTIPTKKTQMFSTAADNQQAVTIKVYQGEREIAAHNKLLGSFDLVGIPPAPRGMPKINVTFDIDANGIVHVEAEDAGSGKKQKIEIQNGSGLSKEEIEKMIRDAEKHAEEDKKYREIAEIKNKADTAIHEAEKALSEYGEKINSDIKDKIHNATNDLKDIVKKQDSSIEELNSKLNALIEMTMKIGESVYGEGTYSSENSDKESEKSNNSSDSNNETIIDTDYKNIN